MQRKGEKSQAASAISKAANANKATGGPPNQGDHQANKTAKRGANQASRVLVRAAASSESSKQKEVDAAGSADEAHGEKKEKRELTGMQSRFVSARRWRQEIEEGLRSVSFSWKKSSLTIPLWLIAPVVAFLVFSNGLYGNLVFDDTEVVGKNPDVRAVRPYADLWWNDYWGNPINVEGVWTCKFPVWVPSFGTLGGEGRECRALTSPLQSYRPITVTTLRWNYLLHGADTFGYHLVNVLLHSACTFLLYFVGLEIFSGDRGMSCLAALIFATHPIHTDAIDSIVGRAEALYGFFYLLGFLAYVRSSSARGTSWGWYGAAVVCFLLSVFSKEMGIMLLGNWFVWDALYNFNLWPLVLYHIFKFDLRGGSDENKRESLWDTLPKLKPFFLRTGATFLVGVSFVLHRQWFVGSFADLKMQIQHNPIAFAHGLEKWLSIFYLHFQYVWVQLWPIDLSCDYSMACIPMVTSLTDPRNLLTLLTYAALLGFLVLSLKSYRWHHVLVVSLSWYIVPFIPASQVLFQPGTVLAERVLYIPSVGICFLISWLLFTAWRRGYITKRTFLAVCLLLLLAYSARTLIRNPDWDTQISLFSAASRACPGSGKARYNWAAELEMAYREEEAREQYEISAAVSWSYSSSYGRLGKIWLKRGNLTKALEYYSVIINRDPKIYHEFAWHDTAYILWQLGDIKKAINFYIFAASIVPKGDPTQGDAETNLGCLYIAEGFTSSHRLLPVIKKPLWIDALESTGNVTQAMPWLKRAVSLAPEDDTTLNNLGVGYYLLGDVEKAREHFAKAVSRPTVRTLIPTDNLRRLDMALKDPSYKPTITYSVLIRP